jgi:two-component system phosphate regulon sensor histidine kinase PhoR
MFSRKFFWKSFLSIVLAVFLTSLVFAFLLYQRLSNRTLSELKSDLQKETETVAELVLASADLANRPETVAGVIHTRDRITIIAPDGRVLADNWAFKLGKHELENHAGRPEFKAAMAGHPIFVSRRSVTVEREMLYYAVPLIQNGKIISVLRLSFPLTDFYEQLAEIRDSLFVMGFLAVLFSLVFAYLLTSGLSGEIETLRSSARRLASGDLNHRISLTGSQEFEDLATDFNRMAEKMQQNISAIEQQHHLTQALLSRMVEGVFAIDGKGKAVFANEAFCKMMGAHPDKIKGRPFLEIVRSARLADYISELLKTGAKHISGDQMELRFAGMQGEKFFLVQASRISEKEGLIILLVFHDITRIKKVDQIRKDFVANVGHELRTPLTAMLGATEVLLDGAYQNPQESKRFLEIMDKQLRKMQNLVTDMLKLAMAEETRISPVVEVVNLNSFLSDLITAFQPLAQSKHQQISLHLPANPVFVKIQPRQLSDAFTNILDNAIQYTQEGGAISIDAVLAGAGVDLSVRDNGPGIPAAQLPRVFERFYRIDKSRSREMGGTGLGLAIAKHAVENHGGTITVQSEPGKGSIFTIHLPASAVVETA